MRGCRAVTSLLLTIANDATAWSHPALPRHRTAALPRHRTAALPRHRTAALHRHRMVATADVPAAPLQWSEEADLTWTFDGSNYGASEPLTVNYRAAGPADAQPFLLVHGFGASGFHWRRNINVLAAAGYRVYAIDLLGFGLSSKPLIEYDAAIWRDQCAAFLEEVAGCGATPTAHTVPRRRSSRAHLIPSHPVSSRLIPSLAVSSRLIPSSHLRSRQEGDRRGQFDRRLHDPLTRRELPTPRARRRVAQRRRPLLALAGASGGGGGARGATGAAQRRPGAAARGLT
jgi:hypothetical protein